MGSGYARLLVGGAGRGVGSRMKKAGVSRGSRHVLRGTAVEKKSSNAPSRKGRGTSTTKGKGIEYRYIAIAIRIHG